MEFDLGPYRLAVATDFGPRITSLRIEEGPEILADLGPDVRLEYAGGSYVFRGGHRLWVAPEDPEITYADDSHEVSIDRTGVGFVLTAPPDGAGLVKEIRVSLEGDALVVDHRLSGDPGRQVAPWAITQFPLGGTAILPLVGVDSGPSANRSLVLWPYSSLEDRRVTVGDDVVEILAVDGRPVKFGVGPSPGSLGYFRDEMLFIKEIETAREGEVPDLGAVGQVYVGQGFCELESVGKLTDLSGEKSAVFRERWTVADVADLETAIALVLGA